MFYRYARRVITVALDTTDTSSLSNNPNNDGIVSHASEAAGCFHHAATYMCAGASVFDGGPRHGTEYGRHLGATFFSRARR